MTTRGVAVAIAASVVLAAQGATAQLTNTSAPTVVTDDANVGFGVSLAFFVTAIVGAGYTCFAVGSTVS